MSWVSDESRSVGIAAHGTQRNVGDDEVSIVGISNNHHKFARHSAMAAFHTQAHGANGKLSACFSQMFGILVSCGYCACS
jgi:hypothetical protein